MVRLSERIVGSPLQPGFWRKAMEYLKATGMLAPTQFALPVGSALPLASTGAHTLGEVILTTALGPMGPLAPLKWMAITGDSSANTMRFVRVSRPITKCFLDVLGSVQVM